MKPVILRQILPILLSISPVSLFAVPGDIDNDGLRDAVESQTGIYVSTTDTGTNPNLADSDGDSLPDGLELNLGTNPTNSASKVKRPNIIYIIADDLGYGDVGCFWQNQRIGTTLKFATPGLDSMASQGAMLTHHYVGASICVSSRSSFLQGRHQGHADIRDIQFDFPLPNNHNIAGTLKTAGYKTIHIGKAGLAGKDYNNPTAHPLDRGFDRFFGYLGHGQAHEHYPRNGTTDKTAKICDDRNFITDAYQDLYTSDVFTAFAKKSIVEEFTNHPDRPFFIYLSYDTPHFNNQYAPTATYPAGLGVNGGLQWTGSPSYVNTAINDPNRVNNPANVHPSVLSTWGVDSKPFVSMVRRMDESVSDILQTLRDLGIDQNTLVVFTSDNGPEPVGVYPPNFQSYAGFEGVKGDFWEGGIRVPTIAWWPGTLTATNQLSNIRKIDRPCVNYDWLATFADLAKIQSPSFTDGISLAPTLTGEGAQMEKGYQYFEMYMWGTTPTYADFPNHSGGLRNQMQAIRIGDFMGVRTNIASATDPFMIYNVVTDPKQSVNLAANRPDLQTRMNYLGVAARRKGGGANRPYDTALIPAVTPPSTKSGLDWKSFEGYWPWLPEFRNLTPVSAGLASDISVGLRSRNNDVGLSFEGYLAVPASGAYTFQMNSNSNTSLWVHDGHVIDNDFNFTATRTTAPVYLSAGLHPIRLYYRHREGVAALELKYSGPGISLQKIPATAFFVDGPPPPPPDRDGDGSLDAEEVIAGTDPDDPESYFKIETLTIENGDITLRWAGVAGRTYEVQESGDMDDWKPVRSLEPVVVVLPREVVVTIAGNNEPKRFFRVVASITPPQPAPDRDGDGSTDAAEAVAGTNPDDPNSFFRIHTSAKSESGMSLQWAGVAGRSYRVEESINLSVWTLVPGVAPVVVTTPQPAASIMVPANGVPKRFLRMQVMLTQ